MKYLIDTDWVINYLKGDPYTYDFLKKRYDDGLAISVITFSEIYEGIFFYQDKKEKLERDFLNFLEGVAVLDMNESIGKLFGELRATLRKKGNLIDNFDLVIAATAVHYDLVLLSNNIKHFERIENLKIRSKRGK